MIELMDEDILLRLTNTEDSTVERKTASDYRDCLKTAVAFSNSLPVDDPGLIFVGVGNDGTVQDNPNLESLQLKVSAEISKVYPPIFPQMKVMPDKGGKKFLVLIVRGSENRPHFAGPSYVRDGTQTKEASEEQFERLIAERSGKLREILKWRGKEVSVEWPPTDMPIGSSTVKMRLRDVMTLVDCNQFYVTLEKTVQFDRIRSSSPLADVEISFDNREHRLELLIRRPPY